MIAAALALLMDLSATLDVADRTELRVRGSQGVPIGLDVTNAPLARIEMHDREQLYWLGYTPSFLVTDLQNSDLRGTLFFQTGSTGAGWQLSRHLRLTVTEDATYGQQNFALLSTTGAPGVTATTTGGPTPPAGTPPATQALASAQTINFVSSRTAMSTAAQLSRRWSMVITASELLAGGADEASRNNVPFQRTERLELGLTHTLTRVDSLITSVAVSRLDFAHFFCDPLSGYPDPTQAVGHGAQCNPSGQLVEASETWAHRLTHLTDVSVSAGSVVFDGRIADANADVARVYPTASIILHRQLEGLRPATGSVTVSARLSPVVDVRTGRFDQRASLDVQLLDRIGPWRTTATVSGAQTVPPDDTLATTLLAGALEGSYSLSKRFELGSGVRGAWQKQLDQPPFYSIAALAFFTYHEPTLLLW